MSSENLIYDVEIIMLPDVGGETKTFKDVDKLGVGPDLTQMIFLNKEEIFINMHFVQVIHKKNVRKENMSKIVTLT